MYAKFCTKKKQKTKTDLCLANLLFILDVSRSAVPVTPDIPVKIKKCKKRRLIMFIHYDGVWRDL